MQVAPGRARWGRELLALDLSHQHFQCPSCQVISKRSALEAVGLGEKSEKERRTL